MDEQIYMHINFSDMTTTYSQMKHNNQKILELNLCYLCLFSGTL